MVHRDLAFNRHVTDGPTPSGEAVVELEAFQVDVAVGVDGARRPFVRGERDPAVADDENRVDRGESQHPAAGRPCGDDE